jgi:hypothetical protein
MDNWDISPQNYLSPLFIEARTERKQAEEQERADTLAQLPLLKQVIGRLEKRIEATDSVKAALELAKKYDISREDALVLLDIVRPMLEAERRYIETRVKRAK